MIHLGRTVTRLLHESHTRPLKNGAATCRAPISLSLLCNLPVALTANPFHHLKDYRIRRPAPIVICRRLALPVH